MQTVTIKEFIPEDKAGDKTALLPAFLEIWNTPENLKSLSFTQKPFDPEVVGFWLDNHKSQGGRYFCAVNKNDEILGVMVIKCDQIAGFEIYGIGIRPEFKRHGFGSKLVNHAICIAEKNRFSCIETLVFADNAPMLHLLLSLGFIPANIEHHRRSDGADAVRLKKYLQLSQ